MLDAAGMIGCQYIWLITGRRGLFSHGRYEHGMVLAEGTSDEQIVAEAPAYFFAEPLDLLHWSNHEVPRIAARAAQLSEVHKAAVCSRLDL